MLTASEAFPAGFLYYKGGKKYAELAAWDVQKESGNKWPLATMNCVMIWGPSSESFVFQVPSTLSGEH